jgi:hypothetical protein
MLKIYDVFTRRIFVENGETQKKWYKVGFIKETPNGARYLRLFHQPDTEFFIAEKLELPEKEK